MALSKPKLLKMGIFVLEKQWHPKWQNGQMTTWLRQYTLKHSKTNNCNLMCTTNINSLCTSRLSQPQSNMWFSKDSSHCSSCSINKKEVPNVDFDSSTSDFSQIAARSTLVDKSLLLRAIFEDYQKMILITVPRSFGKSTNMDMVQKFVAIQVNEKGAVIEKDKSSNYNIFKDNNLLIFQDGDFFNEHFATYPVINVNFKAVNGNTYDEVLDKFRSVLHDTFKLHPYLSQSNRLSSGEKSEFNLYYCETSYMTLNTTRIERGLKFLSECLYKHFNNKKVFVLIDEYDAPINNTMFKDEIDIDEVNELLCRIFSNTLEQNQFVERALLTGISYFVTAGLSGVNNIEKYMFLKNHPFVPYYGLTENEVDDLLTKFKIDDDTKDRVKLHYSGYVSLNGIKLFSIWSIFKFLKEKKIENFWEASGIVTNLKQAIDIPAVRYCIEKFCLGKSVDAEILDKVKIDHIIQLRKVLSQKAGSKTRLLLNPDLYLSFILQQGYLTFEKQVSDTLYAVRAPNAEIVSEFRKELCVHYGADVFIKQCAAILNKISSTTSTTSQNEIFLDFIIWFNEVLHNSNYKFMENDEYEEYYQSLMFHILSNTKFSVGTEFTFPGKRSDSILCIDNLGIIIAVKYEESSRKVLEQVIERCLNVFDHHRFTNITEKIYIGLNVWEDNTANMSVLVNATDVYWARHF